MLGTAFFESPLYVHLSVFAEDAMGLVGVRRHCKCPYLEETCTPEPAFVYISTNEDDDYPEEEPISNKGSETHDDVADSEDLSKSNYNADSCEVVQDDDTVGSYSETVTVSTVDVGQTSEATKQGKEKPYNDDGSSRVKLEVGQMFNTIYHFRQVLRDYCV
ncbi:hypothetical protein ACOSP7_023899 [Xanthoceras sorbifolium]